MTRCFRSISALGLSILVAGTLAAQDQPLGFKKCSAPKVPIGRVRGSGELLFDISAKGKPDTSTIQVLSATGISPAGLRSAVGRQLSACEFNTKDAHLTGITKVRQAWSFEDMKTRFGGAIPSDTGTAMLLTTAVLPSGPIPDTAAILEERPRPLACNGGPPMLPPGGDLMSGPDPSMETSAPVTEATATFELTIDTTGKVIPGSVRTLQSSAPLTTDGMARNYSYCRYAPGRIGGIPVQTTVVEKMALRSVTTVQRSVRSERR